MQKLLSVFFLLIICACGTFAQSITAELEDGTLTGLEVATEIPGFAGTGYVTGFDNDTDQAVVELEVSVDDIYAVFLHADAPLGSKSFTLQVDDVSFSAMIPVEPAGEWKEIKCGRLALTAGKHIITLKNGWGWYVADQVRLTPAQVPPAPSATAKLSDPQATVEAKALYTWLQSLYGKYTLAGQMEGSKELAYIQEVTGKQPALLGFDLLFYSPSLREYGADPKNLSDLIISSAKNHLITVNWTWNAPSHLMNTEQAPWWKGFMTYGTDLDLASVMADPSSQDYSLFLRDIDIIAVELKKFEEAKIPVLWRPLHEASGGWFWWGAKGPEAFVKLWRLMYQRLTGYHNLHNLIWIISNDPDRPDWYPGDDVVDIIGWDQYKDGGPLAAIASGEWDLLQDDNVGQKLVTMSENGAIPNPETMQKLGVYWSWFNTWNGDFINDSQWNSDASNRDTFNHEIVITQDELQAMGWPGAK